MMCCLNYSQTHRILASGLPRVCSIEDEALDKRLAGVTFRNGGDEHGILDHVPDDILPLGSTVQLVPSHCDPTVVSESELASLQFRGLNCPRIHISEPPCADTRRARWDRRENI